MSPEGGVLSRSQLGPTLSPIFGHPSPIGPHELLWAGGGGLSRSSTPHSIFLRRRLNPRGYQDNPCRRSLCTAPSKTRISTTSSWNMSVGPGACWAVPSVPLYRKE